MLLHYSVCSRCLQCLCYALESRSHWFVLLFAASCALGSAYGFLRGAWPFGLVEAVWCAQTLGRPTKILISAGDW